MLLHRIGVVAVSVVLLIAVASEANGGGGTPIVSCGQTVTTSAVLTQDLACTGSGIIVGASGITIDLKGHVIRGDRTVDHFGIDDTGGYDRVAIKNGLLRDFEHGVKADSADDVSVSSVIVTGNLSMGLRIVGARPIVSSVTAAGNGDAGVYLDGASAVVKAVSAADTGAYGIFVNGNGASIASSSVASNLVSGVWVIGNHASFKSVTAVGNPNTGLGAQGDGVSISKSTANGNGSVGISVFGNAAILKGNVANGNGFGDVTPLEGAGITVSLFSVAPTGVNVALGNDDPGECIPQLLC